MIDGIPDRPLYFYQKDIVGSDVLNLADKYISRWNNPKSSKLPLSSGQVLCVCGDRSELASGWTPDLTDFHSSFAKGRW